jgi:hypothetical protein
MKNIGDEFWTSWQSCSRDDLKQKRYLYRVVGLKWVSWTNPKSTMDNYDFEAPRVISEMVPILDPIQMEYREQEFDSD